MCESEDSQNCVWIATLQGNGKGESFVNLFGYQFMFDDFFVIACLTAIVLLTISIIYHDIYHH